MTFMPAHEAAATHEFPLEYVQPCDPVPFLSKAQDDILSSVVVAINVYDVQVTNGVQVVDPIK